MTRNRSTILTINGGSSTIKFGMFDEGEAMKHGMRGSIEWHDNEATLTFHDPDRDPPDGQLPETFAPERAVTVLLNWLTVQPDFANVRGVGHRLVHGMQRSEPERVSQPLMRELHGIAATDPEHMPRAIALLEAFAQHHPDLPQVVCFDTAFHRSMPTVARMLAIPRRYYDAGVERYGFHGLSFAYLMGALRALGDPAASTGCVILAHLGSGASMAAVRAGKSIDTSMGFTPASGLPMGTRSGDLDPGLVDYLSRKEQMTAAQFQHLVHHESGLLGVSATSSDMRELLACEASDPRAGEAIDLFCYQAKKCIGAFAAALGDLHTLVFAGGIGEHAAEIRSRICEGLRLFGIELDAQRNRGNEAVISAETSRVTVRVLHTDEQRMIAEATALVLDQDARCANNS